MESARRAKMSSTQKRLYLVVDVSEQFPTRCSLKSLDRLDRDSSSVSLTKRYSQASVGSRWGRSSSKPRKLTKAKMHAAAACDAVYGAMKISTPVSRMRLPHSITS